MLTSFYRRYSSALLWLALLSFPLLYGSAHSIRHNNDIETWLPRGSPVRTAYEEFKKQFGVEEVILVGIDRSQVNDEVTEGLRGRIARLPGIRTCWSTKQLLAQLKDMGVSDAQARERLQGLAVSEDGNTTALLALLSDYGAVYRKETVNEVYREVEYCALSRPQVLLAGTPVIVTELDRLGSTKAGTPLFLCSMLLCLSLLMYWTRQWKLSLAVLGLTLWAIELSVSLFGALGGEMNFILNALPVMVMVFTIEASLHVLHYYQVSKHADDPLAEALRLCWKPCLVSMLTTTIGLFSVSVTDILPVEQFGHASALGAVIAMTTGLIFTPALVLVLSPKEIVEEESHGIGFLGMLGVRMVNHSTKIVAAAVVLVAIGVTGLFQLQSRIEALDFFPPGSPILSDLRRVEQELTNVDSVEAVVDFGASDLPFIARLEKVRTLEKKIREHKSVRHTLSAATFFPDPAPESPYEMTRILRKAQAQQGDSDLVREGERLWRISARISTEHGQTASQVHRELQSQLAGEPIVLTGIAPLIEEAQQEIFNGFWTSFLWAVLVIGGVMGIALWSPKTAFMAMLPNIAPLCIVFGILGWLRIPVDIGMMMTGSIALGISVDGTFHFLVRFQEQMATGRSRIHCVRYALLTTGGPIFESIVASSAGMLALMMSNFGPTSRFGLLMAILLTATLSGTLILLPCLLTLGRSGVRRKALRPRTAGFVPACRLETMPVDHVA